MKSVPEIIAEIDRRIGRDDRGAEYLGFSATTLYSELRELKEFILSGECEHYFEPQEWQICQNKDISQRYNVCKKCKSYYIERMPACKHEWSVSLSNTTGPGTQTCLRCGVIR